MYKIDLHTHSYGSPDGALTARDYRKMLETGKLDYIAITDHNTVDTAKQIQSELGELGRRIIIGEEITTQQGELIGLFLTETVPRDLSAEEAASRVKEQGGLLYVPHPFETVRSGITEVELNKIIVQVDIIETYNGRAVFQDKGDLAEAWAAKHVTGRAASSDAHGTYGWGRTFSNIESTPSAQNLAGQLRGAKQERRRVGFGILYPKLNRFKKFITRNR